MSSTTTGARRLSPRWLAPGLALTLCVPAPARPESLPPGPVSVVSTLEEAWNQGDVDEVLALFSEEPIELALAQVGGVFPRSQVEFLIRDLFEYVETHEFRVIELSWEGVGGDEAELPVAAALWRRNGHGGIIVIEKLEIELVWEGESWRLRRIRSAGEWTDP